MALKPADHFVVRFYSPLETVGGGVGAATAAPKSTSGATQQCWRAWPYWKRYPERQDRTGRQRREPALPAPGFRGGAVWRLQRRGGTACRAAGERGKLVKITAGLYLHQSFLERQGKRLSEILRQYHTANPLKEGMKREELRSRVLPQQEQAVADGLLDYYARVERIKFTNGMASLFSLK